MKITGLGSAVPALRVTNNDLATFLDTSDEWIRTRTGIEERRILSDEQIEDLALQAANEALRDAGLGVADIDFIICSNVYTAYMTPGLGCVLAGMLGANCASVDINAACAGFVYGLDMAQVYLQSGRFSRIMLLCAEVPTRMADWTDRSTCVLFGDAAAAVILEPGGEDVAMLLQNVPGTEFLYAHNGPGNTPYAKNAPQACGVRMVGQEVYKFAVGAATKDIRTLLDAAGLVADDIDLYVMHQANLRIVEAIRMRFKQPPEKFPHNIERHGNSSSASIPLLLCELKRTGRLVPGMRIAISAFGAGLTAGSCLLHWQ